MFSFKQQFSVRTVCLCMKQKRTRKKKNRREKKKHTLSDVCMAMFLLYDSILILLCIKNGFNIVFVCCVCTLTRFCSVPENRPACKLRLDVHNTLIHIGLRAMKILFCSLLIAQTETHRHSHRDREKKNIFRNWISPKAHNNWLINSYMHRKDCPAVLFGLSVVHSLSEYTATLCSFFTANLASCNEFFSLFDVSRTYSSVLIWYFESHMAKRQKNTHDSLDSNKEEFKPRILHFIRITIWWKVCTNSFTFFFLERL